MSESIFVRALYFGKENPNGFTIAELEENLAVKRDKWGPLNDEFGQGAHRAFNQSDSKGAQELFWLNKGGYELLYKLDEVQQASKDAKSARNLAIISIFFAASIPLLTLAIEHFWPTTMTLNQEQFDTLLHSQSSNSSRSLQTAH